MSQIHLDYLSENIVDQVYENVGLRDCTIMSNIPLHIPDTSFISTDLIVPEMQLSKFADFIHKSSWCLVAIIYLGSNGNIPIGNIKTLIERNVYSNVFFIGNASTLNFGTWNRPAVVIDRTGTADPTYQVHVYCGRLESGYWIFNDNHWTMEQGFARPFGLRGEACDHLLFNQTFKVAQYGLLPNVFTDKSDNSLTGTDVEALKLLADKYKMHLEFYFGKAESVATTADANETHVLAKVYHGKYQGYTPGLQFYHNSIFFDLSYYLLFSQLRYTTRVPQKNVALANVVRGFDQLSWLAVFITLSGFAVTFQFIFYVYKFKIKDKKLYNNPGNPVDFFLLTFTTFVEPDKINWFPTWSAGKLVTLFWSVFALLVISFYTSNLRTNLIAPKLEPEINSHKDVLKYGKTVHIDHILSFLLQLTVSPDFNEVLRRVKEQDKWYYPVEAESLEASVKKAVLEDGDVYLATAENILYTYLLQDTLGFPNLRISDDSLVNFYMCLRLTKFSPYTPDINKLFTTYHELGLYTRFLNKPIPAEALASSASTAQYESSDNLRMSLEMLWTPIILLTVGSVIGVITFIFEIMMTNSWNDLDRFSHRIS